MVNTKQWIPDLGYQIWDPPYFEHQLLDIRLEILYVQPRSPPSRYTIPSLKDRLRLVVQIQHKNFDQKFQALKKGDQSLKL